MFDGVPHMAFNSFDLKDRYEIHVDLPGVKKEDIDLNFNGKILSLFAKRKQPDGTMFWNDSKYGDIKREGYIKADVDRKNIKSIFSDGVLVITFPKSKDSISNKIEIK
jgi:HSP20 family protein